MRISDWSSDVCSSDLAHPLFGGTQDECQRAGHDEIEDGDRAPDLDRAKVGGHDLLALAGQLADADDDEQRGVFQTDDALVAERRDHAAERSEEHTSELQSLMRISYAVFCLKKKKKTSKN